MISNAGIQQVKTLELIWNSHVLHVGCIYQREGSVVFISVTSVCVFLCGLFMFCVHRDKNEQR